MASLGRQTVTVVAAALASLGVAGGGVASAATTPAPPCSGVECPSLRPVNIAATQGTLNVTQLQLENLGALVVDAVTGQPVRGALVQFYTAGGRLLGASHTNHNGVAGVTAPENLGPGTVQELLSGYDAVLLGDGIHTPASAHGAITVGTDWVPLGSTLFSDRTLKRDVTPVDWAR